MNDKRLTNSQSVPPLIVFDLVATLTDAGPRYAEAYIRMCEAWGLQPPEKQDILEALGNKNLKQIIAEFTPDLQAEDLGPFMNGCNNACDALLYNVQWHEDLYPHVRSALAKLKEKGYALGIYTGTRMQALESQLRYHNIADCFDLRFVLGKDNERDGQMESDALKTGQLESIIDSYAYAYGLTNAQARSMITVIGDSATDHRAACLAGLQFMGFVPDVWGREALLAADAGMRLFDDFKNLPSLFAASRIPDARTQPGHHLGL
jgi:phosphoglycolate phosphatase-like HAD superfamily hydrolase